MTRMKCTLSVLIVAVSAMGLSGAAGVWDKKLSRDEKALHALNRLAFGPRPGDLERVRAMGVEKWVELQLNPERIRESDVLLAKLKPLDSLTMSNREMLAQYPPVQLIRAFSAARGKAANLNLTPEQKENLDRLSRQYRERRENKGKEDEAAQRKRPDLRGVLSSDQAAKLFRGTPEEKAEVFQQLSPEQRTKLLEAFPGAARGMREAPTGVRREILTTTAPQLVLTMDLLEQKLYRAIYSEKQLEEALVDFWFNHFNVYLNKGPVRHMALSYERDAIRPHVLGKFKDMLLATAQHPAMLFYLDNYQSVDPKALEEMGRRAKRAGIKIPARARGLNENYGRELLELHTLGVDGGYSQADVVAVARAFTGWTIRDTLSDPKFQFIDRVHDKGEKTVLGKKIAAGGGVEDGMKVIELVAHHPSTARFLSRKLAQRFVTDAPPQALVDRMAATFQKSGGDLREVMRTMLQSREFFSQGAYRAKVKSPFEMVVSAVRTSGADVNSAITLAQEIEKLGQPLYRKEEPTGYYDTAEEWVSTAGLLARMNFSLSLMDNKVRGVEVAADKLSDAEPAKLAEALLLSKPSAATQETLAKGLEGKSATPRLTAGLVLGSPDFQRR